MPRMPMNGRSLIVVALTCGSALAIGCATKQPPTFAEIHQQSGTLAGMDLTSPWKAAPQPQSTAKKSS